MTPQQLKAAKEVLEPLFMIYRLQGMEVEWLQEEEYDPIPVDVCYITIHDGDIIRSICIDIVVDNCGRYSCKNWSTVTWSKLKRLPNQVDYHLREFLKTI
jgi:hypothetical protein